MIPVTLSEIADAVRGRLAGDPGIVVTSVTHDSRTTTPGALFIALVGEQVDGAAFIEGALANGAVAALTASDGPSPRIVVDDPRIALERLAALIRGRSHARVVAITGSLGKTLTKDLTAAAIATQRDTIATAGNFNNELGVPLTVCRLEETTEVLVAEVGARGPGHIAALTPLLAPDVAVVLNVSDAHLGEFGDLDTTARAKAELVTGLAPAGIAILNADDPRTRAMAALAPASMLFGRAHDADIRLLSCDLDARAHAHLEIGTPAGEVSCTLPLPGEHLASNALAAIAVAHALGLDLVRAANGIETATTSGGRMRLVSSGGRLIIDDAYNASPGAMRAALKTLAHLGTDRPSWAILGAMAELGDASVDAHDAIGRLATRLGIGHLVAIGDGAAPIARAAVLEGMHPDDVHAVSTRDEAFETVQRLAEPDAVLLIKASHASRLDLLVERLLGAAA